MKIQNKTQSKTERSESPTGHLLQESVFYAPGDMLECLNFNHIAIPV